MAVIIGYSDFQVPEKCPHCQGRHWAIEDDGDADSYRLTCWCGARTRVRKDDPDLLREMTRLRHEHADRG